MFLGEVDRVAAETQSRKPGLKGEDTATMMLRHRSGAVSLVDCTYESRRLPDPFPETLLAIEGSTGSIVLRSGLVLELTSGGQTREIDVDPPVLDWASRPWHVVQESVLATCAHMLSAVRSRQPAETSAADNVKTFALCEAAYGAASRHSAVAMDEFADAAIY